MSFIVEKSTRLTKYNNRQLINKGLLLLIFFVLLGSISCDAVARGFSTLQLQIRTDTRVHNSLSRKILALTGMKHRAVIDAILDDLLAYHDEEGGGEVFFSLVEGDYHLVKDGAREGDPFDNLQEHLQKQRSDGLVFDLRRDGLYAGMYKGDQHEIVYHHHPLQLNDYYFFVNDDAYYQDLQTDLLAKIEAIANKTKTLIDYEPYLSKSAKKLAAGKKLSLFELLRIRDSIVTTNDRILHDIFESYYYATVKQNGIEGSVSLSSIDEKVAKLSVRTRNTSSYLSFSHSYTWNRVEFENYLLNKTENIGADSIARLRLMENDLPHLRPVLDEILAQHRISREDFEQALVEVSRVFHMLDIDTPIPSSNQARVYKLLTGVAKRKNKVLQDYFTTLVLRTTRVKVPGGADANSAYAFLQRIYLIEDMILLKKKTSPHQTVRKLLAELGIGIDAYLDYTSNINHYGGGRLLEGVAAEFISRDRLKFTVAQFTRYEEERVATLAMLSNIVAAMYTNFTADTVKELLNNFLRLQPDVAIVKEDKTVKKGKQDIAYVVKVEVIAP